MAVKSEVVAKAADREYLIRRSMTKGYQYLSLLSPPLYTFITWTRRTGAAWTVNKLLRATWIGGAIGIAEAGAFEFLRTMHESEESLQVRRLRAAYNISSIRADDHSTIGAVLGAVLTPALLWKRGRSVHLFLGGAGIGAGAGLLAHWGRTFTEGGPPKTESPVPASRPTL